jgi:hypothetical protein
VRGWIVITAADAAVANALRVTCGVTVEMEGGDRPACVAEVIAVRYR